MPEAESRDNRTASAPIPPTQFYTLRECRSLFKLNLALLVGAIALGIVSVSGVMAVGIFYTCQALFQFKKMEKGILSGVRFPKPAPRVPKNYELWIWPPLVSLLTVGVIWLTKKYLLQWLLHPATAPLMFALSIAGLLYLLAGWCAILWTVGREYRRYVAAKRAAARSLADETPVHTSHWWTDTQAREDAIVTARR